ncbi:MAG: isoleucine--tRNA ligase, partial [Acidobacteria bacterium]
ISAPKSPGRRAAQTVIWHVGEALVRLLAPIMSFTCDEVWQSLPRIVGREDSVHLATFPAGEVSASAKSSKELDQEWTTLRAVRDEILKALEDARNNKQIAGSL